MFRFGLKKEEQEILTRTIAELQELRKDLAHLKNALTVLNPQEYIESGETHCSDHPSEGLSEPHTPKAEPIEKIGPVEEEPLTFPGNRDTEQEEDLQGKEPAPEQAVDRIEWAVVHWMPSRKKWWRDRLFEKKGCKRNI